VLSGLPTYGEAACPIRPGGEATLDRFADGHVFVLNLVAGGDARGVVDVALRTDVGEEEVEDDFAAIGAKGEDQVGIHDAFVDVQHEVGVEPEVPGAVAVAGFGDNGVVVSRGFRGHHRAGLQAVMAAVFDGVVGVVEDAVEALVQVGDVVAAIEIVVDVDLPVAFERVLLAGVEVQGAQAERGDLLGEIVQVIPERRGLGARLTKTKFSQVSTAMGTRPLSARSKLQTPANSGMPLSEPSSP